MLTYEPGRNGTEFTGREGLLLTSLAQRTPRSKPTSATGLLSSSLLSRVGDATKPSGEGRGDPQWSRDLVSTELLPIEFIGVISAGFSPPRLDRGVLDLGLSGTAMRR